MKPRRQSDPLRGSTARYRIERSAPVRPDVPWFLQQPETIAHEGTAEEIIAAAGNEQQWSLYLWDGAGWRPLGQNAFNLLKERTPAT